jgi:hypothetical protein
MGLALAYAVCCSGSISRDGFAFRSGVMSEQ